MEFEVGRVVGSNGFSGSSLGFASVSSEYAAKQKWCGSTGFLKKEGFHDKGDKKPTKFAKLSNNLSDGVQEHNLLSFSSPKNSTFPYYFHTPNSFHSKNSGYSSSGSMYGPFTPSQWFELEQQALIYKYIIANVPIPSNLLIPMRRAFETVAFSSFSDGLLRPNSFGWGPFHFGFANSTDPEPGRCRRTDGKKWRCSRDAVPDQKYCERHMNRGCHRSRKPVEGATTNINTCSSTTNVMSMASSLCDINLNQSKGLQPVPLHHLPSSLANRFTVNKTNSSQGIQDSAGHDFLSPRIGLNLSGNTFSATKSAADDFAFLTSGSILNTTQHSHHFFTEDQASIFWPKQQTQAERPTHLSISIPPADFMSSTSSPTGKETTLSPLRLSREFEPALMGLGVNTASNEPSPRSWGTSLGGPLGEVLKTTANNPQPTLTSPTGVLSYLSNSSTGSSTLADSRKALKSSLTFW